MRTGVQIPQGSEFAGRTAIVTGAGSGIGRSVSLRLGELGANVVLVDIDSAAAGKVAEAIRAAGGIASEVVADVTDHVAVAGAVAHAVDQFGGLNLAFNNAGIGGPLGPTHEIDIDAYHRLMDINLHSVFYALHAEIPAMLASGGGAIVNTSSIYGSVGFPDAIAYTASKHGVTGLTRAAALDYASKGIRVNSVHPGFVETPLLDNMSREAYSTLPDLHPMGRIANPDEIADAVIFLLSDRATFITGSQLHVDGGYTAQ